MIPGINEVQTLATKYSKPQLAQMAQNGLIDPTKAVMAGMMIDRIASQAMQAPQSTVAQDVMAPPAPQSPQMGMQQPPQGQPQQPAPAGVAGIPAPNMESMAGGGIVAFNDGGDVPGYAGGGLGTMLGGSGFVPGGEDQRTLQRMQEVQAQSEAENQARIQAIRTKIAQGVVLSPSEQQVASMMKLSANAAPTPQSTPTSPFPLSTPNEMLARRQQGVGSAPAVGAIDNPFKQPAPPVRAPGLSAAPAPRPTTAPAVPPTPTGIGSLTSKAEELRNASGYGDLMSSIKGLRTDAEAANKREEELAAKRPEFTPYEKYKADLDKEAAGVEDKKSENTRMAIINAGLAIMSGKSQYALQNIGEGAQVGTKQYAEGLKEIAKADKERQKALAEIEQAQNLYKEGKYDRAEARAAKGEQRLLDASKTALTVTGPLVNQNMSSLVSLTNAAEQNKSAESIAAANRAAQAAIARMPPAQVQILEMVKKSMGPNATYAEAYDRMQGIGKTGALSKEKAMEAYTKDYITLKRDFPTFEQYWNSMQGAVNAAAPAVNYKSKYGIEPTR